VSLLHIQKLFSWPIQLIHSLEEMYFFKLINYLVIEPLDPFSFLFLQQILLWQFCL
jgi:hypothetical protein